MAKLSTTAATAVDSVAKSAGKVRPPGEAKYRATTESELAESYGEVCDVAKSGGQVRRELLVGRTSQVELPIAELWLRWLREAVEGVSPPRAFKPHRPMTISLGR